MHDLFPTPCVNLAENYSNIADHISAVASCLTYNLSEKVGQDQSQFWSSQFDFSQFNFQEDFQKTFTREF